MHHARDERRRLGNRAEMFQCLNFEDVAQRNAVPLVPASERQETQGSFRRLCVCHSTAEHLRPIRQLDRQSRRIRCRTATAAQPLHALPQLVPHGGGIFDFRLPIFDWETCVANRQLQIGNQKSINADTISFSLPLQTPSPCSTSAWGS